MILVVLGVVAFLVVFVPSVAIIALGLILLLVLLANLGGFIHDIAIDRRRSR